MNALKLVFKIADIVLGVLETGDRVVTATKRLVRNAKPKPKPKPCPPPTPKP